MADTKKIIPQGVGWPQEKKYWEGVDGPKKILNSGDQLAIELEGQRSIISAAGNLGDKL